MVKKELLKADDQPEGVASVFKIFNILQILSEQKYIGVADLSRQLMMPKSTAFRFLQTMKTLGVISQEGESDKYTLTLKLFKLGSTALNYLDLIDAADKKMRLVALKTSEAVHIGGLDGDGIIYIHKIDSAYKLRMQSRIGGRNPLYCTAIGKVLLAYQTSELTAQLLKTISYRKLTNNTLINEPSLLKELDKVKQQGFAEDNEEQELGICCIAVPIFDRFGIATAGLSISFPSVRRQLLDRTDVVSLLIKAAGQISTELGFEPA